ncbi:MAG: hypothetical protein ACLSUW_01445 [Akkermansia sp.]
MKTTNGRFHEQRANGRTDPATANLATVIRTAMTRLSLRNPADHQPLPRPDERKRSRQGIPGGGGLPALYQGILEDKLGIPISFNPMHNVGVGSGVDVNTISREAFILGGLIGTAIHPSAGPPSY